MENPPSKSALSKSAPPKSNLHVLVIDDSAVVRQLMTQIFSQVPGMSVLVAPDPLIAMKKMDGTEIDVIVLDLEMPRMDGLTFLERLMKGRPLPVVVCSSIAERGSKTALRALELGAVEVVAKPRSDVKGFLQESANRLVQSVRAASRAKVRGRIGRDVNPDALKAPEPRLTVDALLPRRSPPRTPAGEPVIALGASTGGTEAIGEILADLPADICGTLVVQHMPGQFTKAFAERLDRISKVRVKEAAAGDRIERGLALVAPGDKHLVVVRSGPGFAVDLLQGPPVRLHRPSADVLFRSVAQTVGANSVGVILTGMGDDGAQGLLEMREAGALTLAQDEQSCIVFGMPKEAIARGAAAQVAPLSHLAGLISRQSASLAAVA